MSYLPYILLTPVIWLVIAAIILRDEDMNPAGASIASAFIVSALWGLFLLLVPIK